MSILNTCSSRGGRMFCTHNDDLAIANREAWLFRGNMSYEIRTKMLGKTNNIYRRASFWKWLYFSLQVIRKHFVYFCCERPVQTSSIRCYISDKRSEFGGCHNKFCIRNGIFVISTGGFHSSIACPMIPPARRKTVSKPAHLVSNKNWDENASVYSRCTKFSILNRCYKTKFAFVCE